MYTTSSYTTPYSICQHPLTSQHPLQPAELTSHLSTSPAYRTQLSPLNILSSLQNSLVTSQHPLQPAELNCHLSTSSPAYRTHLSPLNILSSLQNSIVTSQHPLQPEELTACLQLYISTRSELQLSNLSMIYLPDQRSISRCTISSVN